MKTMIAALFAALACPSSALAESKTAQELDASVREAQSRGAQMYSYDQAAWHATDQFQLDMANSQIRQNSPLLRSLRGYVVEPGDNGKLVVVFYAEQERVPIAFARYVMSGSDIVRGGIVSPDGERGLSPLALQMIAARAKAVERMQTDGHSLCTTSPANTLILPPDATHPLSVYILSSTTENDHYPAGGHYRFDIDSEGQLVAERAFMKSCIDIDTQPRNGERPAAVGISHLLDETPTEIHAFISNYVPVPLFVITAQNERTWKVANGKIVAYKPAPKN